MIVPVIESGGQGYNKKICNLLNRLHNIEYNNKNYNLGFISFNQYIKKYKDLLGNDSVDIIYEEILKTLYLQNNINPDLIYQNVELPFVLRFSYEKIQDIKNFHKYNYRKYKKKKNKWIILINNYIHSDNDISNIIVSYLI